MRRSTSLDMETRDDAAGKRKRGFPFANAKKK
jgi:hypothetical protein